MFARWAPPAGSQRMPDQEQDNAICSEIPKKDATADQKEDRVDWTEDKPDMNCTMGL